MSAPSKADVLNLGSRVAGIKAKTPPKVWKAFVNRAHARGFTVEGMLSGEPDALKARTHASLKAQAQSTVNRSYAPSITALNDQEARVNALGAKRTADDKIYREWLTTQTDKLAADAKATDAQLQAASDGVQQNTQQAWFNAQQQAHQAAAATPGNVSDPNQSTALNLAPQAAAGDGHLAAALNQLSATRDRGTAAATLATGALQGQEAAAENQHIGQTAQAIQGVVDARTKLGIAKSGDAVKEFARLLDQEVSKAQNSEQVQVAAQRLGIDQNKINASLLIANANRHAANTRAAATVAEQAARLAFDKGKADLNSDGVVDAKDYALRKRLDAKYARKPKADAPGGKLTASDRKYSRTQYATTATVYGQLKDLQAKFPAGKTNKGVSLRQVLRARGYSDPMIDVAVDLAKNGGKLSAEGIKKAKALGIIDPGKLWGKSTGGLGNIAGGGG